MFTKHLNNVSAFSELWLTEKSRNNLENIKNVVIE